MSTQPVHRSVSRSLFAPAPPAEVFPLLCPVRERDWVDGWQADVLHSLSGVAEKGCVFSAFDAIWVVTVHTPPKRIEFAIVEASTVQTLAIELVERGGGTLMTWTRCYTGLTADGNGWILANVPDLVSSRLANVESMLVRYLERRCLHA